MAKGFAAMPWYVDDWRASTARLELEPLARLAYLEMCFLQWSMANSTRKSIPKSLAKSTAKAHQELSLALGLKTDEWSAVRDVVISRFQILADGSVSHPKVAAEISKRQGAIRGGKSTAKSTAKSLAKSTAKAQTDIPSPSLPILEEEDVSASALMSTDVDDSEKIPQVNRQGAGGRIELRAEVIQARWNDLAQAHALARVTRPLSPRRLRSARARLDAHPDFWAELDAAFGRRNSWAREARFPSFDQAMREEVFLRLTEGFYEHERSESKQEDALMHPQNRRAISSWLARHEHDKENANESKNVLGIDEPPRGDVRPKDDGGAD